MNISQLNFVSFHARLIALETRTRALNVTNFPCYFSNSSKTGRPWYLPNRGKHPVDERKDCNCDVNFIGKRPENYQNKTIKQAGLQKALFQVKYCSLFS